MAISSAGIGSGLNVDDLVSRLMAAESAPLSKYDARTATFQSKLDLFSNYLDKPQNIDVNWENLIDLKVNRLISVSIFTHLVYDDDIDIITDDSATGNPVNKGPRVQFKETLGVGLAFKF